MELIRGVHNWPDDGRGCVLTIGNFDGVHLGHQQLLQRTVQRARALGVPAAILSFEPTPREYFSRGDAPGRISTLRAKLLDLAAIGIDRLIVQRFGRHFAALEAADFVRDVLVRRLGVRSMVIGDDFRFGARRAGDIDLLRSYGLECGFDIEGLGSVMSGHQRCSSTAVRAALATPDLVQAAVLLGRPYRIVGRVRGGLRLGRQLGMPTANIGLTRSPALRLGVYVVELRRLGDAHWRPAVANLGVRPTLGMTRCLLETHVLDADLDLYGATVEVCFLRFLRPEARFDSLEALRMQMMRDRDAALAFFAADSA